MAPERQPNSQGKGWDVVGQQEVTDTGPDGKPTPGVKVLFKTHKGLTGSVFVPRSTYNPENVTAAICDYVAQLHAVQDLKG